jgi:DNA gyrase/topoisomerase IV subunit A
VDEDKLRTQRISDRREIVEAVLWALTHGRELVDIVSSCSDRRTAVDVLMSPPHNWASYQAHHMLDVTFGRLTDLGVDELRNELERLNRGEDTSQRP